MRRMLVVVVDVCLSDVRGSRRFDADERSQSRQSTPTWFESPQSHAAKA